MASFIIYSMGRSRTAWLSAFLSYKEWKCYHEVGIRLRSLQDIEKVLNLPNIGILETAAIHARPIIKYIRPDIKEVVILRPLEDIMQSFLHLDTNNLVTWDKEKMHKVLERGCRELKKLSELPTTLSVNFEELATEQGCQKIFEHCLPYDFDKDWWEIGKEQNIQLDTKSFFEYYVSNKDSIEIFKQQLKQDLRNLCRSGLVKHEMRI